MISNKFDPTPVAVINPENRNEPVTDFPKICVGIFSKAIVDRIVEGYGGEVLCTTRYCTGLAPIYRVGAFGTEVALFMPYVGAPSAARFMEDMVFWGGRHFVFCGAAGALDRGIRHGGLVLPVAAMRDEGLSYHYLPPSDEIEIAPRCVQAARQALKELDCPYIEGKTWTTDGFFRETEKKVTRRQEQGCICVEMECAGLAAVAQFRGVDFVGFFYVTDTLDGPEWDGGILSQGGAGLEEVCFRVAVETRRLLEEGGNDAAATSLPPTV